MTGPMSVARDARLFGPRPEAALGVDIGLTEREAQSFSFVKLLRACIDQGFATTYAGFEVSAAQRAAAGSASTGVGLMIPGEVMRLGLQRDLTVGTATAGGHTVGTIAPSVYWGAALRAATRVRALGATVIQSRSNVTLPRVDSGATGAWVAENAAGSEQSPTFAAVTLSPKTVTAYVDVSRRLLLQAEPSAEAFIVRELAEAIGTAIDQAAIVGTGASGQPRGILNTVGIGTVALGTNGAAPTYAALVDQEYTIGAAHAEGDGQTLGFLTNSKVRRVLRKTEAATGSGLVWAGRAAASEQGRVLGLPAMASEAVPSNLTKGSGTNLSAIVYANWSELFLCEFGGIGIIVDRVTQAAGATVRITLLQDVDIALRRPEAAAAIVDAIAA